MLQEGEIVTQDEALVFAERVLDESVRPNHDQLNIVVASSTEYGGAFVFGYNSREFLDDRTRITDSLVGNGPIVVEKSTGKVWFATSAYPLVDQLERAGLA
jgi:hypothetical protein